MIIGEHSRDTDLDVSWFDSTYWKITTKWLNAMNLLALHYRLTQLSQKNLRTFALLGKMKMWSYLHLALYELFPLFTTSLKFLTLCGFNFKTISIQMTLEEAIGYVASDELIEVHCSSPILNLANHMIHEEHIVSGFLYIYCYSFNAQVTPKTIRLRKRCLDVNKRKSQSKRAKE